MRKFVESRPVFSPATAPLAADGCVTLSPTGSADALGVLHESTLTFPDAGGSHAEAIAHLREDGRITAEVFCAGSARAR
ncbi:hypothetical protein ACFW9O_25350 [Streptomyces sp. NPDC059499]|uniref:hypothetical protein n=1 Tax=Streptomyces sp. NPDC059499 TaxID=3346852 RepID=UPI00367BDD0D